MFFWLERHEGMLVEYKTNSVMVVGADMPVYRMILILLAYTLMSKKIRNADEENALTRPKVKVFLPITLGLVYMLLGFVFFILFRINGPFLTSIFLVLIYYFFLIYFFRKKIVIWFIHLYQMRAPAEVRAKCVFTPSCSEYMILAIRKFGLVGGVKKGIDRLRRCGPPSQIDYP